MSARLVRGGLGLTRGFPLRETSACEISGADDVDDVVAERLESDGYLFVRGLFPREMVLQARREIEAAIANSSDEATSPPTEVRSLLDRQWIANIGAVKRVL